MWPTIVGCPNIFSRRKLIVFLYRVTYARKLAESRTGNFTSLSAIWRTKRLSTSSRTFPPPWWKQTKMRHGQQTLHSKKNSVWTKRTEDTASLVWRLASGYSLVTEKEKKTSTTDWQGGGTWDGDKYRQRQNSRDLLNRLQIEEVNTFIITIRQLSLDWYQLTTNDPPALFIGWGWGGGWGDLDLPRCNKTPYIRPVLSPVSSDHLHLSLSTSATTTFQSILKNSSITDCTSAHPYPELCM